MDDLSAQVDFVRVLRTPEEIEELRPFWDSCQKSRGADPAVFALLSSASDGVLRPHVIVVYRDRCPRTMLLGRCEESRLKLRLGYLRFPSPKHRRLSFIHGGLVGDGSPAACAALIESIAQSLASGEADVATVHYVDMRSALYAALVARPGSPLAQRHVPMIHMARTIGSEESFSATLSRGERSQFKRRTRALSDRFKEKVRVERFCDPSRLERLIEDAEIVARKSYQRQLEVGFRDTTEIRQQLRLAAEKGWLLAHILYLDDQPCSFWITSVYGGILHSDYLAYDPSFGQYSVGMVLMMMVLDTIYRERTLVQVNEIDFGVGDAEYKRRLSNRSWEEASLSLFAPRPMGFTLRSLDFIVTTANSAAIAVLNRSGLLSRVKRWWRRKLTRGGQEQ